MSQTEIMYQPKLKHRVLNVLRLIFVFTMRFWCRLCYGRKGKKIPPIANDILKLPAMEVARKIRNQEISSVEVLEACIKRIKEVNSKLNFFIDNRFEVAFREAREADALIRNGTKTAELEKDLPLLGVPFTTKDSIAVKGLVFASGIALRKNVVADKDADVITLLKQKGAIVIGLTNVPELCLWWESYNQIYGRTKNPHNTTRIVGGSSGGEGSCQAAGGSIFGIGSDIGGSIRMPCFFNGIFGHKPSRYTVSNEGQYPDDDGGTEFQEAMLSIGPMTRHASDLKPILNIIAGEKAPKLRLDEPVNFKNIKFYYQYTMNVPLTDKVDPEIISALNKVVP